MVFCRMLLCSVLCRKIGEMYGMLLKCEWGMGNGEWGMGNGEWGMGNSGQR